MSSKRRGETWSKYIFKDKKRIGNTIGTTKLWALGSKNENNLSNNKDNDINSTDKEKDLKRQQIPEIKWQQRCGVLWQQGGEN